LFLISSNPTTYLKGGNDGARCDAALCIAENNLIKHMEDADIKLCINKKKTL
jgi:hypothetical protein